MKTLQYYKELWEMLTEGDRPSYTITNISLDTVKCVMREYGYYRPTINKMGIMDDFKQDVENKYIKKREFTNWEARQRGLTEFYCLTVKGCKELYNSLKAE